jgi:hypothetical protein
MPILISSYTSSSHGHMTVLNMQFICNHQSHTTILSFEMDVKAIVLFSTADCTTKM